MGVQQDLVRNAEQRDRPIALRVVTGLIWLLDGDHLGVISEF